MHSDGRSWSVKLANSATTERSDIYERAGIGYTLAQQRSEVFNAGCLTRTIESYGVRAPSPSQSNAVQCRGTQNDAATFSYTPWPSINGCGLRCCEKYVAKGEREFSVQ